MKPPLGKPGKEFLRIEKAFAHREIYAGREPQFFLVFPGAVFASDRGSLARRLRLRADIDTWQVRAGVGGLSVGCVQGFSAERAEILVVDRMKFTTAMGTIHGLILSEPTVVK